MGSVSTPNGWEQTTLGELIEIIMGQAPPGSDCNKVGTGTIFVKAGEFDAERPIVREWTTQPLKYAAHGDVLICVVGATAGKINLGIDCAIGRSVAALRPCNALEQHYLYYFLSSKVLTLRGDSTGSAQGVISKDDLSQIAFPLAPLPEQHRIVAKIEELFSELDKGIENLKTAQAQLKVYRQALLKHAFEGKLTAQWRAENQDKLETADALLKRIQQERAQRYQQQLTDWQTNGGSKPKAPKPLPPLTAAELAELPELPEGWVYVRAEEIAGFITKGTTPSKELLFDGRGEVPFIKVYNLTKTGFLDFSIDPTFVSSETHNGFLARSKVYPGDVLMNIVGPPLGKISIVPNTYPEWNINQAIAIFRSDVISNRLLAAYLAHEKTVRSMMRKSKATAGQFNLTLEICRETLIPLCGQDEQKELELLIEAKLSEVEQLDQTLTTSLQQSEALRQSILKKAFSGQLVPQDPHDEPASALLARIKAERAEIGNNAASPRRTKKVSA
ncbi:MAG: restriction endonuclease subunit S [Methylophilaceae bacterium]|nr:restriction endonuclease subunit S [Methylophilaceae bacterium]